MKIKMYCPNCLEEITKEKRDDVDYPYECITCDENFYEFELVKELNGIDNINKLITKNKLIIK